MARRKDYRESARGRGRIHHSKEHEGSVAETRTEDWAAMKDAPMMQEDNGSMNYLSRKDKLEAEDARKIKSSMLSQM